MLAQLIRTLNPRQFLQALAAIEHEAQQLPVSRSRAQRQAALTLLLVAVCLLGIHYLKFFATFRACLTQLSLWQGLAPDALWQQLTNSGFAHLIGQLWWGGWHFIGYVLLPGLFIRYVLRQPLLDFGLGLGNVRRHWAGYLLLLSPILGFVVIVSFRPDFSQHYPFYRLAGRSWFDLLAWELIYLSQFVFLEFFFRGFMLQSLRPAFGVNAIFVMCLPYLMIHFSKPWLEATGAILFGLFLGVLAMRSRSIWGGVIVHAGVALSMDIAALLQTQGLPQKGWPF